LKKTFFEKSRLTAYFNLSGVFMLVVIGTIAGVSALFFNLFKKTPVQDQAKAFSA
jgi:hypothetical protein